MATELLTGLAFGRIYQIHTSQFRCLEWLIISPHLTASWKLCLIRYTLSFIWHLCWRLVHFSRDCELKYLGILLKTLQSSLEKAKWQ